jgi:hypothetical protein
VEEMSIIVAGSDSIGGTIAYQIKMIRKPDHTAKAFRWGNNKLKGKRINIIL